MCYYISILLSESVIGLKKFHLVCNAHLDPIWQWEWEEGAASALSTYKSAADLCDEFDYVFCHNEVTAYKYIEEYAPELFEKIKSLVKAGKWHITGGWYLQPDVNMPCGESVVRQIQFGKDYFLRNFGTFPKTAYNVDAFGHSVGLVQILKKCGQDNCVIIRRGDDPIPAGQLIWQGLDGSRVKLCAPKGSYNSPLGGAADKMRGLIEDSDDEVDCIMWGVGNHGGGPSRKDLKDIKALIEESKEEICHSTPDAFFEDVNPEIVHDKSFEISMPGCYTSVSEIKQKNAEFEDNLYTTEKMCSLAALKGLIEYPEKEFYEATEDLLTAQFHDVLPGTCIKSGEDNGLMLLNHGKSILNKLRARAYFALTGAEKKAAEGEYPIFVFNPNPYKWETEIECEFMLADQNWQGDIVSAFTVFDSEGNEIPAQFIKETSHLNLDWRKRVVFRAALEPMSVSRFSVYTKFVDNIPENKEKHSGNIVFRNDRAYIEINRKTGLLSSYKINGKEYLKEEAFSLFAYDDNADPWAMGSFQLSALGTNPEKFSLMEECDGVFKGMENIQIIEDGEIFLCCEAFFKLHNTRARIEYKILKATGDLDIKIDLFAGEINKMYRVAIPTVLKESYRGQTAFGTQDLYTNGRECVAQRFVCAQKEGDCIALLNKGTYGSKFSDGTIEMSLLRTATYCAHPILDRPLIPLDRYTEKIDLEQRTFSFRLTVAKENELERLASEFSNPPYACNVFPIERKGETKPFDISLSDKNIVLTTFKKENHGKNYILRLINNSKESKTAVLTICGSEILLNFTKYEAKTLVYDGDAIREIGEMKV